MRVLTLAVGAAVVGSCAVLVKGARDDAAKRQAAIVADVAELPAELRDDVARVLTTARVGDVDRLADLSGHLEVAGFTVAARRASIVVDELRAVGKRKG